MQLRNIILLESTIPPSSVQDKKCFIHSQGYIFKIINQWGNLLVIGYESHKNVVNMDMYYRMKNKFKSMC